MPVYEYKCDHCGKLIEIFGQTADAAGPPAACACGKEQSFSKIFSVFSAKSSQLFAAAGECGAGECAPMGGCCGGQCVHSH